MKTTFHSHANETHYNQKERFLLSLALKVRVFGTRRWPINLGLVFCTWDKVNEKIKVGPHVT